MTIVPNLKLNLTEIINPPCWNQSSGLYLAKVNWGFGDATLSSRICLHETDAAVIHSHQTCWNRHSDPRLDETPAPWLLAPPKIYQNQLNKESIHTSSVFASEKKGDWKRAGTFWGCFGVMCFNPRLKDWGASVRGWFHFSSCKICCLTPDSSTAAALPISLFILTAKRSWQDFHFTQFPNLQPESNCNSHRVWQNNLLSCPASTGGINSLHAHLDTCETKGKLTDAGWFCSSVA